MGLSRQYYCSLTAFESLHPYYSSSDQLFAAVFATEAWLMRLGQRLLHRAYAAFTFVEAVNGLLSSD